MGIKCVLLKRQIFKRYEVLNTGKKETTQNGDGLSNLKYHVTEKIYRKLYVHIKVTINKAGWYKQRYNINLLICMVIYIT